MIANHTEFSNTTQQGSSFRRDRRKPVRWTREETATLVNRMVDLRQKDPVSSALHLLQDAQEALPHERRREILTLQAVPELAKQFNRAWAERTEIPEGLKQLILEVPTTPEPVDPKKVLAEVPIAELAASLFGRIVGKLDALPQTPLRPTPVVPPRVHVPASTSNQGSEKPRLKRIAIVGLLADQQAAVETQVNGKAELRFVDKEQSRTDYPLTVDYVIVQKHSRHRWYEAAVKKYGHKQVAFVDGGITQVVQKVYDFASRQ